jgi:galactokinase
MSTDRTIPNTNPDIIIRDTEKRDTYVKRRYICRRQKCDYKVEKILKSEDLIIDIQRMWNVKIRLIPVIRGAIGTISKSFKQT